jgi:hypothetical protein
MKEKDLSFCEFCAGEEAEIFQVTGDYCLQCWQDETYPNV